MGTRGERTGIRQLNEAAFWAGFCAGGSIAVSGTAGPIHAGPMVARREASRSRFGGRCWQPVLGQHLAANAPSAP